MQQDSRLDEIRELKKELKEIKGEFSKFKPITDWNKHIIERLMENIELTEILVKNELFRQFITLDIDYFKKNIEGLKKVLKSEREFFSNPKRRSKK